MKTVGFVALTTAFLFFGCSDSSRGDGSGTLPDRNDTGGPLGPGRRVLPPPPTVPGLKFPLKSANPTVMNTVIAYRNLLYTRPLFLTYAPDNTDRIFVVEQPGRIYVSPNDEFTTTKNLFLDISGSVNSSGNEEGLLGLAFDPNYKTNGYFFVYYTYRVGTPRYARISRFKVSSTNPNAADPKSELQIFSVQEPYSNHNGGALVFGPDGFLYLGLGDGGNRGDPQGNGQNRATHLGSIIRIDVRNSTSAKPYAVPYTNPFVGQTGVLPEIWAYGLRNPWRFSFDRTSGRLWCGDVGQTNREEIDIIVKGGNYGWRYREGFAAYRGTPPTGWTSIQPVIDYSRTIGKSVTGGYVYRGSKLSELRGAYLYADYSFSHIWALVYENGRVVKNVKLASLSTITSFGEDRNGEVMIVSRNGRIYTLARRSTPTEPDFPMKLSQTGLFVDTKTLEPNPNLFPYDVTEELWSDDAVKKRWLALPTGGAITFHPTNAWDFPIGTVLVKHFELPTTWRDLRTMTRLETRVLIHMQSGWEGHTYKWNAAQTDADLLPGPDTRTITIKDSRAPGGTRLQTWRFPGKANCLSCHTEIQKRVLGLNTRQLNHRFRYTNPRLIANQLETLNQLGAFGPKGIGKPNLYETYISSRTPFGDIEKRARTYLAVNCSQCHQPGGTGGGGLDLRFDTPRANTGTIGVNPSHGNLGLPGAKIIAKGNKNASVLWERMRRKDDTRMPPLGTHEVDLQTVDLIGVWIDTMK
jgi:uncharacterized repeat protein (TIGR03806 family)